MPLHPLRISRRIEVNLVRRMLRFGRNDVTCDVGCGDGYWTRKIAGGRLTVGIDIDQNALDKAGSAQRRNDIAYLMTSVTAIPCPTATFDKIFGICSIEHVPDNVAAFSEMSRCLKPGGELVLTLDSLSYPGTTDEQRAEHHRKYFTPHFYDLAYAEKCLRDAGLQLVEHRYIICSSLAHRLYRIIDKIPRVQYVAFPILYPLILWSDAREKNAVGGWKLAVKAIKK